MKDYLQNLPFEKMNLVLIGVGNMGRQIARKLPAANAKTFIDFSITKEIEEIASISGANCTTNYSNLTDADIIILAVNPSQIEIAIESILKFSRKQCLLINIATSKDLVHFSKKINIVNLKIIGQSDEIKNGQKPAVIIPNIIDESTQNMVKYILNDFGLMVIDDVTKYDQLNKIIATDTLQTIFKLVNQLEKIKIDAKVISMAISNVMAGTCKGYPWSKNDEFINNILQSLNIENYDKAML